MRCLERSPTDRMLALAVTARLCFAALSSRPGGGRALMEPGPSRFGSRPRFRSRYAEKYEIVLRNPRVLSGTNPDRPWLSVHRSRQNLLHRTQGRVCHRAPRPWTACLNEQLFAVWKPNTGTRSEIFGLSNRRFLLESSRLWPSVVMRPIAGCR